MSSELLNALEKLAELLLLLEPEDTESIGSIQDAIAELGGADSESILDTADIDALNESLTALSADDTDAALQAIDALQSSVLSLIDRIRSGATANSGAEKSSTPEPVSDPLTPVSDRSENVDDEMFAEFLERTRETMDSIESDLLTLHNAFDQEAYSSVLRQIHTLKGDTGFLGFREIESVCHATETALNDHPLTDVLDMLFEVKDWLVSAFQTYEEGGLFVKNPKSILDAFHAIGTADAEDPEVSVSEPAMELPAEPTAEEEPEIEAPVEESVAEVEEPEEIDDSAPEEVSDEAPTADEGGHPVIDPIIAQLDGIDTDDMTEVADVHAKLDGLLEQFGSEPALATAIPVWQDQLSDVILGEAQDPQGVVTTIRDNLIACKDALENDLPLENVFQSATPAAEAQAPAEPEPIQEEPVAETPAKPAPSPPPPSPAMSSHDSMGTIEEGTDDLISEFMSEANEHLENADTHLLTIETDPQNSDALDAVFRAFHTIKGVSGFLGLSSIQHLGHEAENLLVMAREGNVVLQGELMDSIFESVDQLRFLINELANFGSGDVLPPPPPGLDPLIQRLIRLQASAKSGEVVVEPPERNPQAPKIGDILVDEGVITKSQLDRAVDRQTTAQAAGEAAPKLGEALVKEGVNARTVAQALRAQQSPTSGKAQSKEYVKIDSDRLNTLVDMIGELVIAESMVSLSDEMKSNHSPELGKHLNQLDKITRDLQEIGTSLRMVPVKGTFQKMARIVRDLAKKSGKDVDLVLVGEDTELDKTLVDTIGDPLVHMVRNAVDHGLEANAEERVAAGKSPKGRVELRAFHRGGNIFIEIEDDGRGLNRDRIIKKAVENGLITDGSNMDDGEVWKLIFAAGFSTAEQVTEISGRGVGMDVVRRNIENLRGNIDIRSEFGKGTVFSIRLPLTLAIIDGMIVKCGPDRYVIPTLSVRRLLRPKEEEATSVFAVEEMLNVEGELVPLYYLGNIFGVRGAVTDFEKGVAIVLESNDKRYAIVVDEVLGKQQTVIKPLGGCLAGTIGLSGGAILSDGQVGLIIDVGGVIRLAHEPNLKSQTAV